MQQIAQYRDLRLLGTGGMAVVYQALNGLTHQTVALKTLPEHWATDPHAATRFQREIEVAQTLQHPNIVRVIDFQNVFPYYMAMDFLPGGTLAERLVKGPLGLDESLRILSDIGSALTYAHQRRIVHRDVKPANILFDSGERAILTDFGVVQDLNRPRMTIDGSKLGTPRYMAPEQVRAKRGDSRTDVHALAAVFYEMITGKPPYQGSDIEVQQQILNTTPRPPSQVRRGLPPALDAVVLRGLAKDPEHRFSSVSKFIAAARTACARDSSADVTPLPRRSPVSTSRRDTHGRTRSRQRLILSFLLVTVLCLLALGLLGINEGWIDLYTGSFSVLSPGTEDGGFLACSRLLLNMMTHGTLT